MQTSRPSFTQRNTERRSERRYREMETKSPARETNGKRKTATQQLPQARASTNTSSPLSPFSFLLRLRDALSLSGYLLFDPLSFSHTFALEAARRAARRWPTPCNVHLRTSVLHVLRFSLLTAHTTNLPPFCRFLQTNGDMS